MTTVGDQYLEELERYSKYLKTETGTRSTSGSTDNNNNNNNNNYNHNVSNINARKNSSSCSYTYYLREGKNDDDDDGDDDNDDVIKYIERKEEKARMMINRIRLHQRRFEILSMTNPGFQHAIIAQNRMKQNCSIVQHHLNKSLLPAEMATRDVFPFAPRGETDVVNMQQLKNLLLLCSKKTRLHVELITETTLIFELPKVLCGNALLHPIVDGSVIKPVRVNVFTCGEKKLIRDVHAQTSTHTFSDITDQLKRLVTFSAFDIRALLFFLLSFETLFVGECSKCKRLLKMTGDGRVVLPTWRDSSHPKLPPYHFDCRPI